MNGVKKTAFTERYDSIVTFLVNTLGEHPWCTPLFKNAIVAPKFESAIGGQDKSASLSLNENAQTPS